MTSTPEQKPLLIASSEGRFIHRLMANRQLDFWSASEALAAIAEFASVAALSESPGGYRGGTGCTGRLFFRRHHLPRHGRISLGGDAVFAAGRQTSCRPDQFGDRGAAQDLPGFCRLSGAAGLRGADLRLSRHRG